MATISNIAGSTDKIRLIVDSNRFPFLLFGYKCILSTGLPSLSTLKVARNKCLWCSCQIKVYADLLNTGVSKNCVHLRCEYQTISVHMYTCTRCACIS